MASDSCPYPRLETALYDRPINCERCLRDSFTINYTQHSRESYTVNSSAMPKSNLVGHPPILAVNVYLTYAATNTGHSNHQYHVLPKVSNTFYPIRKDKPDKTSSSITAPRGLPLLFNRPNQSTQTHIRRIHRAICTCIQEHIIQPASKGTTQEGRYNRDLTHRQHINNRTRHTKQTHEDGETSQHIPRNNSPPPSRPPSHTQSYTTPTSAQNLSPS